MFEIVGRGGHSSLGLISTSSDGCNVFSLPQQWTRAISLGPDHANTSPVLVTTEALILLGSIMGSGAQPISFSPGIENARTVESPKIPIMANSLKSKADTWALTHEMSPNALDAPFEVAGLKILISDCVTEPSVSRTPLAHLLA